MSDQYKSILLDPATKATTVLAMAVDAYGIGCLEWDPASMLMQLSEDHGVQPLRKVMDRLHSASSLLLTNLFHITVEPFVTICAALGQGGAITNTFVPAGLEDVMWGVTEAALIQGSDFKQQEFSDDIALYVGFLLEQEGLYDPPSTLKFAKYPSPAVSRSTDMFLDDELAYQAYWQSQQDKKKALELLVPQGLMELFQQLERLPLENKDTSFISGILSSLRQP